jgi:hypothetical protein
VIWFLLGPGPSMSKDLADRFRGLNVGTVGNAYELAPWADFLAATDASWWSKHPQAKEFEGRKFSPNFIPGVEGLRNGLVGSSTNSGVLGLEACHHLGATTICMVGFDFGSGHFFGNYTNGLKNTTPDRRKVHAKQFKMWRRARKTVRVVNCTPDSKLDVFEKSNIDEFLRSVCDFSSDVQMEYARISSQVHGGSRQHAVQDG